MKGLISKLAKAAGCDRTYLSQALNSKVHLTPDHILGLCDFFEFNSQEEDYLLSLLLMERSASSKVKEKINTKLGVLRAKALKVSGVLSQKESDQFSSAHKNTFYSSWLFSAAHLLTSDEKFQSVTKISQRLNISELLTLKILRELVQMNLVIHKKDKFVYSGPNIHIAETDPLYLVNHQIWRDRAQISANLRNGIHYTSTFMIDEKDVPALKRQLLELISNSRSEVSKSGTEDLYSFCTDFFKV